MANVGSGAAGKTLIGAGNGASPTYASIGTNSGLTAHGVLVAQNNSAFQALSAGTSGQVLQSGGSSANPSYSTCTYPATAGTSGNVLTSDGTNWNSSAPVAGSYTCYSSWLFSSATDLTGDSTTAQVPFDSSDFNIGGFTGSSKAPVIPVTGIYSISWVLETYNATSVNTVAEVAININGSPFGGATFNPGAIVTTSYLTSVVSGATACHCNSGDIITMTVQVYGGSKTVGVAGLIGGARTTQMIITRIG